MNKTEIIEKIAKKNNLKKAEVANIVDEFINEIVNSVTDGNSVEIAKFGKFYPSVRKARLGRDFYTGEKISIEEKTIAKFTPFTYFKDKVNTKS